MKSPKNEIMITVRMSQEMRDDLKSLADKEDRKLAEFIRIKLKQLIVREKENTPRL
jgi:predicted DNA-binding protein